MASRKRPGAAWLGAERGKVGGKVAGVPGGGGAGRGLASRSPSSFLDLGEAAGRWDSALRMNAVSPGSRPHCFCCLGRD